MPQNESARLLIADDYDTGRALLCLHLGNCGYQVEEASDGKQALELALSGRFDLLILDIEMPEINGLDVLRTVREKFTQAALPVIMISARDESPDVVSAFAAGANDYVTKPIDLAVTEARIRTQLLMRPPSAEEHLVPELSLQGDGEPSLEPALEEEASRELKPGTVLGPYRLVGVLGKGGMGTVYEALNVALDRPVALKILPVDFDDKPDALARFRREAKLAARIEHPNVVGIYDVGKWQGRYYLAMQLIRGESLDDKLKRDGPFPELEARRLVREITLGLSAAHSLGIIHRDIKPSNILLAGESVKLADFGLARPRGRMEEVTVGNRPIGTPEFMSPEQFAEKDLEMPADIYALGITWFLLLTGRAPFQDEETLLDLALAHLNKEPPDVRQFAPDTPDGTARLLARMLSKDPLERPADAEALLTEIDALD